jgi:chromosome segregation ATPase
MTETIMKKDVQINEMEIEMNTMRMDLANLHEKLKNLESENIDIKKLNCEMEKKLTALEAQKETFVHLLEGEKHKLMAMENKYELEITSKISEAEDILKMTKDLEQRITNLPDKVEGAEKSNKTEPKFSQELFDQDEWEIVTKYGYNDLKRIIRNISVIGQDRVAQQMMEVIPHPTVCFIMEKALQNK